MATLQQDAESDPLLREIDPDVVGHADRIVVGLEELRGVQLSTRELVRMVWERVSADAAINDEFHGAQIRLVTMQGRVANRIMALLGHQPDFMQMMSIGDVDLPDFAKTAMADVIQREAHYRVEYFNKHGAPYDLTSKGSEEARRAMVGYFDEHYGFSEVPGLSEALAVNSCITNGGMRALDDIATGFIKSSGSKGLRPRFMSPDNSFGTWWEILETRGGAHQELADVTRIGTSQEARLHLTADDVEGFYAEDGADQAKHQDLWYITPVGNPSGTKMTPDQLFETCSAIIAKRPQATIVLDAVYVRTLPADKARALFANIIQTPEILDRVIFVESFSKTHGLCGERLGSFMASNPDVFTGPMNANMKLSAGNGHSRSALVRALCDTSADQEQAMRSLHEFWANERRGLYQYLIGNGDFTEIFDPDQSHITEEDLRDPLGLYLFVKLRPGVEVQNVLLATGCLGVFTQMGSGTYMRLSVGKFTKPTFAKYLPASSTKEGNGGLERKGTLRNGAGAAIVSRSEHAATAH